MRSVFIELTQAFHVRGQCVVLLAKGRERTINFARIVNGDTPEEAQETALQQIKREANGLGATWNDVQAKWVANQYKWTFEEEEIVMESS